MTHSSLQTREPAFSLRPTLYPRPRDAFLVPAPRHRISGPCADPRDLAPATPPPGPCAGGSGRWGSRSTVFRSWSRPQPLTFCETRRVCAPVRFSSSGSVSVPFSKDWESGDSAPAAGGRECRKRWGKERKKTGTQMKGHPVPGIYPALKKGGENTCGRYISWKNIPDVKWKMQKIDTRASVCV